MSIVERISQVLKEAQIIELSHKLEEGMPAAPGHNYFFRMPWNSMQYGDIANSFQCIINEHTGTHVDAPSHFIAQKDNAVMTIDELPVENFMKPAVVLKIPGLEAGQEIMLNDIKEWERENRKIKSNEGVLLYTGWEKYWAIRPNDRIFTSGWPGLSFEAAEYFVDNKVSFVGIDCLCIDSSSNSEYSCHKLLLKNNIPIFENLKNLDMIDKECFLIALPLCIAKGSASPVRVIAFIDSV